MSLSPESLLLLRGTLLAYAGPPIKYSAGVMSAIATGFLTGIPMIGLT